MVTCAGSSSFSSVNSTDASSAYRAFKQTRFFASLDGLRAFSILAVIWFHTVPSGANALLGQGNKGVTLFFAISGFLIVTLLLRAKEATGTFSLPRFWGRRMLRIFPVYYAVLAAYLMLVWRFENDPIARQTFFDNLPAFATFTANWFVDLDNARVIFYIAWSLAAEEQFYLLWPWIERFAQGRRPLALAIGGLIVTQATVFALGPIAREQLGWRIFTSVPAAILLGVILAHLLHDPSSYRRVWALAGRRGSAFAAAALAGAALALTPAWGNLDDLVVSASFTFLVATCVIREDNDLAVLLRVRSLAWIGTISYGLYLMHMIAVNLVRKAAAAVDLSSPYFDFVVGTLLAITVASLSYLTYERFFLSLKDRWFTNAAPRSAPKRSTVQVGATMVTPVPDPALQG